ncbi:MAG: hypothetical protein L0099_16100, partial [Acidobacteria bacterium]|nr:hypothetical protein [Acidobacteriota bacterium]
SWFLASDLQRLALRSFLGVPSNMIFPPLLPPSGPRSMIQSAFLMTPYFCPKIGLSLVEKGISYAPNFAQKSAQRFWA